MENGSWLSKDEIQMARDLIGASSQTFRGPGLGGKSRNAGYLSDGTHRWEGTLGTASPGCEVHREHGKSSGMRPKGLEEQCVLSVR